MTHSLWFPEAHILLYSIYISVLLACKWSGGAKVIWKLCLFVCLFVCLRGISLLSAPVNRDVNTINKNPKNFTWEKVSAKKTWENFNFAGFLRVRTGTYSQFLFFITGARYKYVILSTKMINLTLNLYYFTHFKV